jgi:hypothetical protein
MWIGSAHDGKLQVCKFIKTAPCTDGQATGQHGFDYANCLPNEATEGHSSTASAPSAG